MHDIDVNASDWDNRLDPNGQIVLGFRQINGFSESWARLVEKSRANGFADFAALVNADLPAPALIALAEADAFRALGLDRRAALWHLRGMPTERSRFPLLLTLDSEAKSVDLPVMNLPEHVVMDYQSMGLSLKAHPLRFLRTMLAKEGAKCCSEAASLPDGTSVVVAGIVLVRQRPGSAEGVVFATIEDETGIANIVIWPDLTDRFRREIVGSSLLLIDGYIQRSPEGIVHIVARKLRDRSELLKCLDADSQVDIPLANGDEMPPARLPRSRDFR